jgi:hypothetical protein
MRALIVLLGVTMAPALAMAQASITGVVTNAAGEPMPGVAVDASSPALIEKSRTTTSDGRGRYRLDDLRPGVYTVTFTVNGWRPCQQEGLELTGSSVATLDARLVVGALTDTITVRAVRSPVDVHSTKREWSVAGDVVASIPTARSYNALLVLVPGVVTNANDTVTGAATTSFPIHGGRTSEGRLSLDGLTVGSPPSGNSATSYATDVGHAEEITFTTAGGSGETETAGLVMNIVPRSGGNTMRGSVFASGTGGGLQSDELTPALREQGIVATPFTKLYDVSGELGGPIARDRVWFLVTGHVGGSSRQSSNVYYNLNAGDPTRWLYAPDTSRREYSDRTFENAGARVTWQITPRHKVMGFWDAQVVCRTCTGATPGANEPARASPEAVGIMSRPLHVSQATWTSPMTSRWLIEAGFVGTFFGVGNFERKPNPTRDLVRVAEQCASGCAANGNIPGLVYRSQDFSDAHAGSYLWKGSVSYVTGTHSLKIGYQQTLMTDDRTWMTNNQSLAYRFDNGVPNQLTQSISPWVNDTRVAWSAAFLQEQWTRDRLTLQGAVRFDRASSWFPAQQQGPSRFLQEPLRIPKTRGVDSYKDVTVRVGAAYDLAGRGRTALRLGLGRYLEGAGVSGNYANTNPTLRMPQTTSVFGTAGVTRAWTDANRNFIPDCDLLNPAAQDLRASGGDACGVLSNTSFGRNVLTSQFDPRILRGWGVRPSDWHFAASLQQQVGLRSAVSVTYTRRWFNGFLAVDNLALQPEDLTPFSIAAPLDPRLPGGGGYLVSGLFDVVPEKAGLVDLLVADSSQYGQWVQRFDGIDVVFDVRASDLTLMAGVSTGQTVADNCVVRARLPELATTTTGTSAFGPGLGGSAVTPASPYCRVAYGVLTQLRGFASYIVPKVDLQLAAIFQSRPGPVLAANYAVPNSAAAPALGRNLSGNAANVVVNLMAPGSRRGERVDQLDLRVARTVTGGRFRILGAVDVYNALNASPVLSYNNTFVPGGTWLQPLTVLTPRFLKVSAEVAF